MPGSALATITTPSTARMAATTLPMKFMEPGVSTRSSWCSSQVRNPRDDWMLLLRSFSSAAQSSTLVPASTAPGFPMVPPQ